jgi:hypothetical protein
MNTAKPNPAALQVAQRVQRPTEGYYAAAATLEMARDPHVKPLFSKVMPGQIIPVAFVPRKNGSKYPYHFHHFLDQIQTNAEHKIDLRSTYKMD